MLNRLFPRVIDNAYSGQAAAIWLLTPIVILKTLMGFNVAGLNPLVSSRDVIMNADGVPIDSFSPEAASILVFNFAAWGLALFTLCLFAWVVLIRYRAMIPLACLLLGIEQIGRKGLGVLHPIIEANASDSAGLSPAFFINWGLSGGLALAFVLSLIPAKPRSNA